MQSDGSVKIRTRFWNLRLIIADGARVRFCNSIWWYYTLRTKGSI